MQKTTTSTKKKQKKNGSAKLNGDRPKRPKIPFYLRKGPDSVSKNSAKRISSNHFEDSLLKETWVIPVELCETILFYHFGHLLIILNWVPF